ncbi:hypothetical protein [Psychromonas sp.]|uniref:acyltransferase n=1 Tax=Psychromonas sp. TaxID=1884585 RepID=UPI0035654779
MLNLLRLKLRNKVEFKGDNHKVLFSDRNRIRYCDISLRGNNNTLSFDNDVNLKGVTIEVDGNNCRVHIGKNTVIGEQTYLSCRGQDTKLTIGESCMFSRNVKIMTSDGHNIYHNKERINLDRSIFIGNKVWLADNCVVLKGNTIHDGAIIAINAVVTKDVPTGCIAAGNPASVVKTNIEWSEELG